jgi:hypothetical protein
MIPDDGRLEPLGVISSLPEIHNILYYFNLSSSIPFISLDHHQSKMGHGHRQNRQRQAVQRLLPTVWELRLRFPRRPPKILK